jgi:hypothetical protein
MAKFALAAITKLGGVARCVHLPEMRFGIVKTCAHWLAIQFGEVARCARLPEMCFGVGVKCAQQSEFGLHCVAKFAR